MSLKKHILECLFNSNLSFSFSAFSLFLNENLGWNIHSLEQERISYMSSKPTLGLPWWDHRKKEKEDNSRRVGLVPWSKENKSTWLQIICPIYHSTTTQNHHVVHSKCSHSSTKIWQTAVVNVGIYYESFYLVLSHFDSDSNTTSYQLL